jgi:hypothetical protein
MATVTDDGLGGQSERTRVRGLADRIDPRWHDGTEAPGGGTVLAHRCQSLSNAQEAR